MRSQVKLGDNTDNNLVVQVLRIYKGKVLQAVSEVEAPLTHDVVQGHLLGLGVVGGASNDHVIGVGVSVREVQRCKQTRHS